MSCDEMTGIQALERAYPRHDPRTSRTAIYHIRHGGWLIVSWDVATGQVRVLIWPPLPAMKPTLPTTLLTRLLKTQRQV